MNYQATFELRYLGNQRQIAYFKFKTLTELQTFLRDKADDVKTHYSLSVDGRMSIDRYAYISQDKYLEAVTRLVGDITNPKVQ